MSEWKNRLGLLWKLSRLRMTVFSAVTYAVFFSMGLRKEGEEGSFLISDFFFGWIFVLLCQLTAHFLGEYYDFKSDSLNRHASPFTGGSRVLLGGQITPKECRNLGWACIILAFVVLFGRFRSDLLVVGVVMIFLSSQYSSPPLILNHNALGELNVAILTNVILPFFAASLASPSVSIRSILNNSNDPRLILGIVPAAFIKFALFLVLNLADKRSDWIADKVTIPVKFGDQKTGQFHLLSSILACLSSIYIFYAFKAPLFVSLLVFSSCIPTLLISLQLISKNRPYQLTLLVFKSLQASPLPILIIYFEYFFSELFNRGVFVLFSPHFVVRILPILPFLFNTLFGKSPPPFLFNPETAMLKHSEKDRIIIVGGGIGGIILAISFQKLGLPFILLESKDKGAKDDGADLALWPSSVKILRELGIDEDLLDRYSYPVRKVHMTKLNAEGNYIETEDIMRIVDMEEVVKETGEYFRLVSRRELMDSLYHLQKSSSNPGNQILFGAKVVNVTEHGDYASVTLEEGGDTFTEISGRIVLGADGINSICRKYISALYSSTSKDIIRYSGEVCYRGVSHISEKHKDDLSLLFLENEKRKEGVMTIFYGEGIRASWGLINKNKSRGYWWIKVKSFNSNPTEQERRETISKWPYPFAQLYNSTDPSQLYVHPISDRIPTNKWCSERIALVGDAAHPITPNMGQGANMAIEDAFVLSILIREHYFVHPKDGHQEAFYNYVFNRYPHTRKVADESYQQSKVGQWTNPLLVSLRETILRKMPNSFFLNKLKKTNLFGVEEWIQRFSQLSKE